MTKEANDTVNRPYNNIAIVASPKLNHTDAIGPCPKDTL